MLLGTAIGNRFHSTSVRAEQVSTCLGSSVENSNVAVGVSHSCLVVLRWMARNSAASWPTTRQACKTIAFEMYDPHIAGAVASDDITCIRSESDACEGGRGSILQTSEADDVAVIVHRWFAAPKLTSFTINVDRHT